MSSRGGEWRRRRLTAYRLRREGWQYGDIALALHVSPERARQLVLDAQESLSRIPVKQALAEDSRLRDLVVPLIDPLEILRPSVLVDRVKLVALLVYVEDIAESLGAPDP